MTHYQCSVKSIVLEFCNFWTAENVIFIHVLSRKDSHKLGDITASIPQRICHPEPIPSSCILVKIKS